MELKRFAKEIANEVPSNPNMQPAQWLDNVERILDALEKRLPKSIVVPADAVSVDDLESDFENTTGSVIESVLEEAVVQPDDTDEYGSNDADEVDYAEG